MHCWWIEMNSLFNTCNVKLNVVGTRCMSQMCKSDRMAAAVGYMGQKLLYKAGGWGLERKSLFCAEKQKPESFVLLVPNAQKSWSGTLFPFLWRFSSSWLKNHEFRRGKKKKKIIVACFYFFSNFWNAFITNKWARLSHFEKKTEILCYITLELAV